MPAVKHAGGGKGDKKSKRYLHKLYQTYDVKCQLIITINIMRRPGPRLYMKNVFIVILTVYEFCPLNGSLIYVSQAGGRIC